MSETRQSAKSQIERLVKFFELNIHQFKSQAFNETQARNQLIDPLFDALGWDVHNKMMKPLYLQEVVPEGRVKTNIVKEIKEQIVLFEKTDTLGEKYKEYTSILDYIAEDEFKASSKEAIKKPDYRFRMGGQTKFFVEAKKPFVDLSKRQDAIFQVKRYGFSGRVPISILTDFEEFRVFDCTHRPLYEKPKLGIIKELDFTYLRYLEDFDKLYDTFSREAVAGGSLETLTKKLLQKKTGDFALDKAFLDDLSKWREELARDIARHPKNKKQLNDYTLNESVQRILDRIVFFRVCEDREIEVENTLLAVLRIHQSRPGVSLYSLLVKLFQQRKSLYNGLLFSPHESEELEVSDGVLIKILQGLNYPFSPYHFNEIGVEILGSIYEKFLGKTIHLTAKTVRIEEKPEVRKAGGVYYTPQYIVQYIVGSTVEKMIEGKTPKQIAKLKIIDIACGSGSFLLGAFQKLIDYHIEWYAKNPKGIETVNNVPDAYEDTLGNLRLSSRKKRDILVNNIYGVDIDRQAVEVSQMSLYLKVLEGESAETLNPQMHLALHEVYLPSLVGNIKCGNSLIGTDFVSQEELFNDNVQMKINPFNWENEFSDIIKGGGFDCVIGNPPYLYSASKEHSDYFQRKYKLSQYQTDFYVYFIEKSLSILNKNGKFSYIVTDAWLNSEKYSKMRNHLLTSYRIEKLAFFEYKVFDDATIENSIFVISRLPIQNDIHVDRFIEPSKYSLFGLINAKQSIQRDIIDPRLTPAKLAVINKIEEGSFPIQKIARINRGIHAYRTDGYGRTKYGKGYQTKKDKEDQSYHAKRRINNTYIPELKGKDIFRYYFQPTGIFLSYGDWLAEPREKIYFFNPKIALRKILSKKIQGTLIEEPYALDQSLYILISKENNIDHLKFILGILTSQIGGWYIKNKYAIYDALYPWYTKNQLELFPLKPFSIELIKLVDKMLSLNNKLRLANFDSEKEPIERQITATDKMIDSLVYQIYGLTEEEIKIVEE